MNARKRGWIRWIVRRMVFVGFAGTLMASAGLFGVYINYSRDLPPLPDLVTVPPSEVGTIRAADGQILGRYSESWRAPLPYEKIPRTLLLAFLATEDARFFSHRGIDFRGILRAAIKNVQAGGVVEGGSTITQQLAKSLLSHEKTFDRKIKEALLSQKIEARYSKEDILLLYLNRIYLGNGSHGIQAASYHYFHRPVWELTLGEMAMLGGLPQAPSRLDPTRNMEAALKRRRIVLNRMVAKGFIQMDAAERAAEEPLRVHRRKTYRREAAPWCAEEVRKQAARTFGKDWMSKGYEVYSTCDVQLGHEAETVLRKGLEAMDKRQGWRGALEKGVSSERQDTLFGPNQPLASREQFRVGNPLVAVVDTVTRDEARVHLPGNRIGRIRTQENKWAGPYSEFPMIETEDGRKVRNRNKNVSLDPRLKDLTTAIDPRDALLIRLGEEEEDGVFQVFLEQIPRVEGAFLSADSVTGHVKAVVGSYHFKKSQVNRVKSIRQTGSLMKPIVYAKAYDMGLPPSTLLSGAPFREGKYNPTGNKATEDLTAWDGLAESNNAISLRVHKYVLEEGSLADYQSWGESLGLGTSLQGYTSEILGTEQSLWDMTGAYLRFALAGDDESMQLLRKVVDSSGETIFEALHPLDEHNSPLEVLAAMDRYSHREGSAKLSPEALYIMAANMQEVTRRGTAKRAGRELPFPSAGKTGTLPYDVWFIGWTPDYIGGVWIGADRRNRVLGKSEKRNKVHGGNTALPIWIDWMKTAHNAQVDSQLLPAPPRGIDFPRIDAKTGLLSSDGGVAIPHKAGTSPTEVKRTPEENESVPNSPIAETPPNEVQPEVSPYPPLPAEESHEVPQLILEENPPKAPTIPLPALKPKETPTDNPKNTLDEILN